MAEIQGFIEEIGPMQIRGWARLSNSFDSHVDVEARLEGRVLASMTAKLYRKDLELGGVGAGDHGFVLNLNGDLTQSELSHVSVCAVLADGEFHELIRLDHLAHNSSITKQRLEFKGVVSDLTQHPVFVLGAARSGTSAMAEGLFSTGRFSGEKEGHCLDLMAYFAESIEKFYKDKNKAASPENDTTLVRMPKDYVESVLAQMFIKIIGEIYPTKSWVDKTPSLNMIRLAPLFLRLWPNSHFIFMKRRSIENIVSRVHKFPDVSFLDHCCDWSAVMMAWLEVREELSGVAIEVDQKILHENPGSIATVLQSFLSLSDVETSRLEESFRLDQPERTPGADDTPKSADNVNWSEEERKVFSDVCSIAMNKYNYSQDIKYFQNDSKNIGVYLL
jgi:hypothetical protein